MDMEDIAGFLSDESERFLLLAFRGESCLTCKWQLYYPNLLTYYFEAENDLIFGTVETNKAGSVVSFCDVDPESAKLEIRLITKGGTHCEEILDKESLVDFVTEYTGKLAKKSYVKFQNMAGYKEMVEDKSISHFVEFMSPYEKDCYDFSIQVEKAAEAFAMEPSIDFTRIDCSLVGDLCEELRIQNFPSMQFLNAENVAYNQTYPDYPTTDSIIRYVNELIGTHRVVDGGLDEEYGRDPVLDELAISFAEATEDTRKSIMKRVAKERKRYTNSAIYYGVMKDILQSGTDIIFDHVNTTAYELERYTTLDEKYAPLIARMNILHMFEPIESTRSILLSPQNVDRVLNGHRNVMVLFYDIRCPDCREFAQVYKDAFAKHPLNVFFASVNAARFETLRIRFNVTNHPVLKYFRAEEPLEQAQDIPDRNVEGIIDWINQDLAKAAQEQKNKEAEMAAAIDEEEEGKEL